MVITFYISVFVQEKESVSDEDEDEIFLNASQAPSIFYDLISKKSNQTYFMFLLLTYSVSAVNQNLASVYLTDELKFPKESISSLMIVAAPANILCSIFSGYFTAKNPFKCIYWCTVAMIVISSYQVLVLIYNFPKERE